MAINVLSKLAVKAAIKKQAKAKKLYEANYFKSLEKKYYQDNYAAFKKIHPKFLDDEQKKYWENKLKARAKKDIQTYIKNYKKNDNN